MKKHLIVIGTAVLLLVVGLSGCNELNNLKEEFEEEQEASDGDTEKVELVSYSIKTYLADSGWDSSEYRGDGFIHDEEAYGGYYKIEGKVKNIAGEKLSKITITAKFYDSNNNYLDTKKAYVSNIANSYTEDFVIEYNSYNKYFEDVDSVKFEITAS